MSGEIYFRLPKFVEYNKNIIKQTFGSDERLYIIINLNKVYVRYLHVGDIIEK